LFFNENLKPKLHSWALRQSYSRGQR